MLDWRGSYPDARGNYLTPLLGCTKSVEGNHLLGRR